MNAKAVKALALAAAAVILLGQPALARGGGFGGGYGGGFGGGLHGFGAIGVHGFNGGYSPSVHGEGKYVSAGAGSSAKQTDVLEKRAPSAVAGSADANGINKNAATVNAGQGAN